jgi:hypothetical protein
MIDSKPISKITEISKNLNANVITIDPELKEQSMQIIYHSATRSFSYRAFARAVDNPINRIG